MAIRGLGIPEKGFREFGFAKLTGYRIDLQMKKSVKLATPWWNPKQRLCSRYKSSPFDMEKKC